MPFRYALNILKILWVYTPRWITEQLCMQMHDDKESGMCRSSESLRSKVLSYAMSVVLAAGLVPTQALAEAAEELDADQPEAVQVTNAEPVTQDGQEEPSDEETRNVPTDRASEEFSYVRRSWDGESLTYEIDTDVATVVPSDGIMTGGMYYLNSDVTVNGRIELLDDTELVLGDGHTLDVMGIYIPEGKTLTIYGQNADSSEDSGRIVSHPSGGAAIGAFSGHPGGEVIIHGGTIEATGGDHCAAIGSNDGNGTTSPITIYGGNVTATGGSDGAGIGGGRDCDGGDIKIYGGDVTAKGGGENGAGIGGGDSGDGGSIEVWGGTLTCNENPNEDGAGIGGGDAGNGGNVTINGGDITCWSRDGAGIGGGDDGDGGTIAINGGTITCWDEGAAQGSRIGGGSDGDGESTTITGGAVHVHFRDGSGIGGGEDGDGGTISISGGEVHTYPEGQGNGAGIGGGNHGGAGGNITITGGLVDATSSHGAGIGGGRGEGESFPREKHDSGHGGTINITGGEVHATSEEGIGIGAGGTGSGMTELSREETGSAGHVTISKSADVTAIGSICGMGGDGGTITIKGGTVTASGNPDSNIGAGIDLLSNEGKVSITGGDVTATGKRNHPGLSFNNETLSITGGKVTAYSDDACAIGCVRTSAVECCGHLIIKGENTVVKATSQTYSAIGGSGWSERATIELGPDAVIECISGNPMCQLSSYYGTARVTSGDSKETAQIVRDGGRWKPEKYRLIEPCDHEGTMEDGMCWACGYVETPVYVEYSWVDGKLEKEAKDAPEDISLFPKKDNADLPAGWYFLNDGVNVDGRINLQGDTHLILGTGRKLDVKGITVPEGSTLYVYGQTGGSGKIVSHPDEGAGIGACPDHTGGNVVVHGGTIEATGHDHCAGIGSNDGDGSSVGSFTLYNGTVTATGGTQGAGIGGGRGCDGGTIKIFGGKVTATGMDSSAGIGGGDPDDNREDYSDIEIYGGTVTATGNSKGAGIGGGEYGHADIKILGGTVSATGGPSGGAGIGSGVDGTMSTIRIVGAAVDATASSGGHGIGDGKRYTGSTILLGYTRDTMDSVSIIATNYGGMVTLENDFKSTASNDTYAAGFYENPTQFANKTLVYSGWPLAQVLGYTVALNGEIGVNAYLILGDDILANQEDYQVEVWDGDTQVIAKKISEVVPVRITVDDLEYVTYRFTVTTAAKDFQTPFTLKIKDLDTGNYIGFADRDGSPVPANEGVKYSVVSYLEDRIENSENPNMVQLAKDMKAYCTYAKHYFDVRDHGSKDAVPTIEGFTEVTLDDLGEYASRKADDIGHFTYMGSTLVLDDKTSFRLYFESDDPGALTITCDGIKGELEVKSGKGMHYVEVPNIAATELGTMYDFTIANDAGEMSDAHHGPFGYAYWALSTDATTLQRQSLQRTMMGLYRYNQAAKAYFATSSD